MDLVEWFDNQTALAIRVYGKNQTRLLNPEHICWVASSKTAYSDRTIARFVDGSELTLDIPMSEFIQLLEQEDDPLHR